MMNQSKCLTTQIALILPTTLFRILIIGGSGSGKTNVLLNLIINQRQDIKKIHLCVKNQIESKYQKVGIKKLKNPKFKKSKNQTEGVLKCS